MRQRLEVPPVEVNVRLLEIETRLAELLAETHTQPTFALRQIIAAVERSGCDAYFTTGNRPGSRKQIDVLALDLAWLTPGPLSRSASKGKQFCFCRHPSIKGGSERSWYARVLQQYFGTGNAASLLSLPSVYSRKSFVQVQWLTAPRLGRSKSRRGPLRAASVWRDTFDPLPIPGTELPRWSSRFKVYKRLILDELRTIVSDREAGNAMLAWVYVGPETEIKGSPPPWGVSLFLLYRFLPNRTGESMVHKVPLLLSNLHSILRNVAPRSLGGRTEQQNLAQALAHEFKNLTQDIAVISQSVLGEPVSTWSRKRVGSDDTDRQALYLGIQAVNAFSQVAYWLFTPNPVPLTLIRDKHARTFKHALALAIRLIAPSRENWDCSGVPTFEQIFAFFHETHKIRPESLERLAARFPLAFLLFFALEPVRNIRGRPGETVSFRIDTRGNRVLLRQTMKELSPSQPKESNALGFLMSQVRRYGREPLISIDPLIRLRSKRRTAGGYIVERVTNFTVHKIISFES